MLYRQCENVPVRGSVQFRTEYALRVGQCRARDGSRDASRPDGSRHYIRELDEQERLAVPVRIRGKEGARTMRRVAFQHEVDDDVGVDDDHGWATL